MRTDRHPGTQLAIDAAGGVQRLATLVGVRHPSVSAWRLVPVRHLLVIEEKLGISRALVRPDLYAPRRVGRPRKGAAK